MINLLVGGAIGKFNQIAQFIVRNKNIFDTVKLTVYDGINNCKWNGGRINRNCFYTQDQLDFYYNHNVDIKLVFTNPVIDVDDKVGNELLEKFHRPGNGITLVNEDLRKHIRKTFPNYKLTYSITGIDNINVPMQHADIEMYKSLEQKYDLIVPRAEHNLDPMLLQLNKSQYEIYITEGCCTKCPVWAKHFESIATGNRTNDEFTSQLAKKYEDCWLEKGTNQYDFDAHLLDENHVVDLLNKGFKYFKLSGRDADHRAGTGTFKDYTDLIKQIYNRLHD